MWRKCKYINKLRENSKSIRMIKASKQAASDLASHLLYPGTIEVPAALPWKASSSLCCCCRSAARRGDLRGSSKCDSENVYCSRELLPQGKLSHKEAEQADSAGATVC